MEFNVYLILSCVVLLFLTHVFGCDDSNCIASNGTTCNGQGVCDCGVCKCDGEYSGPTCEECPTCPSPCDIYKDCVSCKIFGTGPLGAMNCIIHCDNVATFLPVEKSEFDAPTGDDGRMLCRNLNGAYCMESFRIGGMREGYRDLFVRTEEDCSAKYIPTDPPVIEVPMDNTKDEGSEPKQEPEDDGKRKPEDVSAVSGSNQGQRVADNGAKIQTLSCSLILMVTVLYLFL